MAHHSKQVFAVILRPSAKPNATSSGVKNSQPRWRTARSIASAAASRSRMASRSSRCSSANPLNASAIATGALVEDRVRIRAAASRIASQAGRIAHLGQAKARPRGARAVGALLEPGTVTDAARRRLHRSTAKCSDTSDAQLPSGNSANGLIISSSCGVNRVMARPIETPAIPA